jgi:tRNA threonylcarbamoyladenosine biosynthesis protein TsaB
MNVLAIDSGSEILSLALLYEDTIYEVTLNLGMSHIETLMPAIDTLFKESGSLPDALNLIAVGAGPGSFTGLRIGSATAKGISLATHIPMVSVPSLKAYAYGCEGEVVLAVLDARKKRFYAELYDKGIKIGNTLDAGASELRKLTTGYLRVMLTGGGAPLLKKELTEARYHLDKNWSAGKARFLIDDAIEKFNRSGADPDDSGPDYLRLSDAEILCL